MVIGWLTRITVSLAVLFLFGYDAIALTSSHLGAQDDANTAASDAATAWHESHTVQGALAAAQASLPGSEALLPESLVINTDGSVRLRVHRTTVTLVAHHLPGAGQWVAFNVTGSAPAPVT